MTAVSLLAPRLDVILSVDTSNPQVMREAAREGAGLLNDVRAFSRPGALDAAFPTQVRARGLVGSPLRSWTEARTIDSDGPAESLPSSSFPTPHALR